MPPLNRSEVWAQRAAARGAQGRTELPEPPEALHIAQLERRVADLEQAWALCAEQRDSLVAEVLHSEVVWDELRRSASWRLTAPIRELKGVLRGALKR